MPRATSPRPGRLVAVAAAALLAGAAAMSSPPALAAGPVDQEQTQEEVYSAYGVGCPGQDLSPLAQTFVAGRSGALDTLSLKLRAGEPATTPDLQVQIRPATTGVVGADVLAAAALSPSDAQPASDVGYGTGLVTVPFAQPAQVVAGQRYAIVLVVPAGVGPCPVPSTTPSWEPLPWTGSWFVGIGSSPEAYLNGEVVVGYDGATLDTFAPLNPDIWFQTFVTDGVEAVAPLITSLSPAAVAAGAPEFALTLDGVGFSPTSEVLWNGAVLSSAHVSSTRLTATVPAHLVASSGTGTVTVVTEGTATPPRAFFITDTAVGVSSVTTSTSDTAEGTAEASAGDTTGTATGSGTLTVAHYTSNPTTQTFPSGTTAPAYFDVNVSPDSTFSSVTVTVCQLSGTTLYWYDPTGAGWTAVSPQTYDPDTRCVTATLTVATSPSTYQLGGTAFATATTTDTLSAMTTHYVQHAKVHTALQRQVAAAAAAAERGNAQAKDGALRGYVNLVLAQAGKSVTTEDADTLIALAREL